MRFIQGGEMGLPSLPLAPCPPHPAPTPSPESLPLPFLTRPVCPRALSTGPGPLASFWLLWPPPHPPRQWALII